MRRSGAEDWRFKVGRKNDGGGGGRGAAQDQKYDQVINKIIYKIFTTPFYYNVSTIIRQMSLKPTS